jgi:hypothetical protein
VPRRAKFRATEPKFKRNCEHCGKVFTTNRLNKRFHNSECQFKAWAVKNPRVRKTDLDLDTLLAVRKWFNEAPGPEHSAYYSVSEKLAEALEKIYAALNKDSRTKA